MTKRILTAAVIMATLALIGCQSRKTDNSAPARTGADTLRSVAPAPETAPGASAAMLTYTADIKPVLEQKCNGCHAWMKSHHTILAQKSAESVTKGLPIVSPAKPDSSVMVWRVEGTLPSGKSIDRMPKGKQPLPPETIGKIRTWIQQGAADTPSK
jgi:hypothetical protein